MQDIWLIPPPVGLVVVRLWGLIVRWPLARLSEDDH